MCLNVCLEEGGGRRAREVNRRVSQPLAPVCAPWYSQLGTNLLYCDSWDLGADQDTTNKDTHTHTHSKMIHRMGCSFRVYSVIAAPFKGLGVNTHWNHSYTTAVTLNIKLTLATLVTVRLHSAVSFYTLHR